MNGARDLSILHVDTGREYRGGQRQVELLVRGLAQRGHRVGLVVPPGAPLAERLFGVPGIQLHIAPFSGEFSWRSAQRLRRYLEAGDYRLLHTHTAHAITPSHLARRHGSVPLIAHRRVDFPLRRNPLARWKSRWPDAWIAVSEGVRRQLVRDGLRAERIAVVESAIDPARLEPQRSRDALRREFSVAESAKVIVSVGELAAHKGHTDLIAAVDRCDDTTLWIVGEGGERRALESQIERLDSGARIRLLGNRNDVADLLAASDLFVFPSRSGEGSPAAVKEAMALGLPIVASDIPAHRDLGLAATSLFSPGDAGRLRGLIAATLDDLPRARELALSRQEEVLRFFPERMVARTEQIYMAVLNGSSVKTAESLESTPA